jgi:hypothetical protein
VFGGILLIAAGVGLFLTAPSYLDVADRFNKGRARDMHDRRLPRPLTRAADANARWGARGAAWFGRLVGLVAIVVGVVLLIRA